MDPLTIISLLGSVCAIGCFALFAGSRRIERSTSWMVSILPLPSILEVNDELEAEQTVSANDSDAS